MNLRGKNRSTVVPSVAYKRAGVGRHRVGVVGESIKMRLGVGHEKENTEVIKSRSR